MTTRILVGTDFSEDSDRAIAAAHEVAARDKAELAVCHVMPNVAPLSVLFPQAVGSGALDTVALERRVNEGLADRVRDLTGRQGDAVSLFVEVGNDYAALVERAESWRADLVVVASHGKTGMQRALLGSVSEKVIRYAHCNVLVSRGKRGDGPILATTDLSDPSLAAVEIAAHEAARAGKELVVLHVVDTLPLVAGHVLGTPFGIGGAGIDAAAAATLVDTGRIALEGALATRKITARSEVVEGSAPPTIISRAEALDASLLVIATHGRTGLRRAVLGSVAESVVRHAPCPTLVTRAI